MPRKKGEKVGAYRGADGYVSKTRGAQVTDAEAEIIDKARKKLGVSMRDFLKRAALAVVQNEKPPF